MSAAPWPPPPPPAPSAPPPPPPPAWAGTSVDPAVDGRDDWDDIERQAATVKDGPAVVDAPPPQPANLDLPKQYMAIRKRCGDRIPHDHRVTLLTRDGAVYAQWVDANGTTPAAPWMDLPQRTPLTVRVECQG